MRLRCLHLIAYGHFTRRRIDFGDGPGGLAFVHGENEAGKSTLLDAMTDLRFGFEERTARNFLHANKHLRIGGEFVDIGGQVHSFIRRKGRGETLLLADFDADEPMTDRAVEEPLRRALTDGLGRREYLARYGLDRQRMIDGGEQLFREGGEIGSALFAASTGRSNLPETLKRWQKDARELYLASGNARHATINAARARWREHKRDFEAAERLPREWRRRSREHEAAREALDALEQRRGAVGHQRTLLGVLRTVLPLLSAIDLQIVELQALADVPFLEADAESDRRTWEQQIASFEEEARESALEIARQDAVLASLNEDTAVLEVARTVRRCVENLDTLEQNEIRLCDARSALARARHRCDAAVSRIGRNSTLTELVDSVPTAEEVQRYGDALDASINARQRLAEHVDATKDHAATPDEPLDEPPSEQVQGQFNAVRNELDRQHESLQRAGRLPSLIRDAKRELVSMLSELGLRDVIVLDACRPLLDEEIDAAAGRFDTLRATIEGLEQKRSDLDRTTLELTAEQERLLGGDTVVTIDDVRLARKHRDDHWRRTRGAWTEPPGATDQRTALIDVMTLAIEDADRTVDALLRNSTRAARLQQIDRDLQRLAVETRSVDKDSVACERDAAGQRQRWRDQLVARGLPEHEPAVLRAWQSQLREVRRCADHKRSLEQELAGLHDICTGLESRLRHAICATGIADATESSTLDGLCSLGDTVAVTIASRVANATRREGMSRERANARRKHRHRKEQLERAEQHAAMAVADVCQRLSLSRDASIEQVRSTLDALRELAAADAECRERDAVVASLASSIAREHEQIDGLRASIGDRTDEHRRPFLERLGGRLETAERDKSVGELARQARQGASERLANRKKSIADRQRRLHDLARRAGTDSLENLPECLDRSARKRRAQDELDKVRRQLVDASPTHDADALRRLLEGRDAGQLDAQMQALDEELESIKLAIDSARTEEESTRRALQELDGGGQAASAAESMSQAAADIANDLPSWIRLRLAGSLVSNAIDRFRERMQAPMLTAASAYFSILTAGKYRAVGAMGHGETTSLIAHRDDGEDIELAGLSEGTRDQLFLALRLAAVELGRGGDVRLPLVLDDVLMSSDDHRAARALEALSRFAEDHPVIVLSHHRHVMDIAKDVVPSKLLTQIELRQG